MRVSGAVRAFAVAMLLVSPGLVAAEETLAGKGSGKGTGEVNEAQKKALRERVLGRWNALIARDLDKAYEFQMPAYREAHSIEDFKARFGSVVQWHVATVEEIIYDQPEVAKVKVAIDATVFPPGGGPDVRTVTYLDEKWLMVDNQWWYASQ